MLLVYGQLPQPQPAAFVILDDKKGAHRASYILTPLANTYFLFIRAVSQACAYGVHTGARRTGLRMCTCTATMYHHMHLSRGSLRNTHITCISPGPCQWNARSWAQLAYAVQ